MHGDIFRVLINAIQASPNGILATFTAGDNRQDFFESHVSTDFPDFVMPVFTCHDYNFAYRSRTFERADCVSDHWFARDYGKQFIEPHALTAAAGDENCAEHGLAVKRSE